MVINNPVLTLIKGSRLKMAGLVVIGLAVTATFVAQALLVADVLTGIFNGKDWWEVIFPLSWLLVLIGLRSLLILVREVAAHRLVEGIKSNLRRRLLAHLMNLGPGYTHRTRTGELEPLFLDKVEALEGYLANYLPQVVVTLLGSLAIGGYLLTGVDWLIGLVVFAFMPLVLLAQNWSKLVMGEKGRATFRAFGELKSEFIDSLQGMPTLKAFGAGERQGRYLAEKSQRLYKTMVDSSRISSFGSTIMGLVTSGGSAIVVGTGAFRLADGQLSLSQLMIILFLSGEAFRPMTDLARYWHSSYMGRSAYESINQFLSIKPQIDPGASLPEPERAAPALTRPPEIGFNQVNFSYPGSNRLALRDLSFALGSGETVALVGRSGAGKTTVVSLLLRLFDPRSGEITLNGKSLKEYDLATLRAMLAVVAQDTYLFYGTIAANLRIAKPAATQAELEAAARAANAHEFITARPAGYETIIGERGVKLSGGERQRIAIARALLKDAPVLILDEATSSVDSASEAAIQQALERLMAGRTTLLVAHRLSTVKKADRIVVLDNGTALEAGRPGELLERRSAYARLVAAQQEMV